jgi:hypothetical protein
MWREDASYVCLGECIGFAALTQTDEGLSRETQQLSVEYTVMANLLVNQ